MNGLFPAVTSLNFTPSANHILGMYHEDVLFFCRAGGDLSHIVELDLSSNVLGDTGLGLLLGELPVPQAPQGLLLANLRWLGLNDCGLSDRALINFAGTLGAGAFSNLEQLTFVGNQIGDDGIGTLAETALRESGLAKLIHLNLGTNDITDVGCERLARALKDGAFPRLIHLSLAVNQLGDRGITELALCAGAPSFKARLKYLGLGANQIGNRGISALGIAIATSCGLSELTGLWIADNVDIDDDGLRELVDGLAHSPLVIQDLFLQGMSVTDSGW